MVEDNGEYGQTMRRLHRQPITRKAVDAVLTEKGARTEHSPAAVKNTGKDEKKKSADDSLSHEVVRGRDDDCAMADQDPELIPVDDAWSPEARKAAAEAREKASKIHERMGSELNGGNKQETAMIERVKAAIKKAKPGPDRAKMRAYYSKKYGVEL